MSFKSLTTIILFFIFSLESSAQIQISNFNHKTKESLSKYYAFYDLPGKYILATNNSKLVFVDCNSGNQRSIILNDSIVFDQIVSMKGDLAILRSPLLHDYVVHFDTLGYKIIDTVFSYNSRFQNEWTFAHKKDLLIYFDDGQLKKVVNGKISVIAKLANMGYGYTIQTSNENWFLMNEGSTFYYNGIRRSLYDVKEFKYSSEIHLTHSGLYLYTKDYKTLYKVQIPSIINGPIECKPIKKFEFAVKPVVVNDTLFLENDSLRFEVRNEIVIESKLRKADYTNNIWEYNTPRLKVMVNREASNIVKTYLKYVNDSNDTIKSEILNERSVLFKFERFSSIDNLPREPIVKNNKILLIPTNLWDSSILLVEQTNSNIKLDYMFPVKRQSDSILVCIQNVQFGPNRFVSLNLTSLETHEIFEYRLTKDLSPMSYYVKNEHLHIGGNNIYYRDIKVSKKGNYEESIDFLKGGEAYDKDFLINGNVFSIPNRFLGEKRIVQNDLSFISDSSTLDSFYFKFYDYLKQKEHLIRVRKEIMGVPILSPKYKIINSSTILFEAFDRVFLWKSASNEVIILLSAGNLYNVVNLESDHFILEQTNNFRTLNIYYFDPLANKLEKKYSGTYRDTNAFSRGFLYGKKVILVQMGFGKNVFLEWKNNSIIEIPSFWSDNHIFALSKESNNGECYVLGVKNKELTLFSRKKTTPPLNFGDLIVELPQSVIYPTQSLYILGFYKFENKPRDGYLFHYDFKRREMRYLDLKIKNIDFEEKFGVLEAYDSGGFSWFFLFNEEGFFKLNSRPFEKSAYKIDSNGIYVIGNLFRETTQMFFLPFSNKTRYDFNWKDFK